MTQSKTSTARRALPCMMKGSIAAVGVKAKAREYPGGHPLGHALSVVQWTKLACREW